MILTLRLGRHTLPPGPPHYSRVVYSLDDWRGLSVFIEWLWGELGLPQEDEEYAVVVKAGPVWKTSG